ncbi:hypothetical protein YC2023_023362 [Brassica napus]
MGLPDHVLLEKLMEIEKMTKNYTRCKAKPLNHLQFCCPGFGVAKRLLNLALRSLDQCLEWKRDGKEHVDMKERSMMPLAICANLVLLSL